MRRRPTGSRAHRQLIRKKNKQVLPQVYLRGAEDVVPGIYLPEGDELRRGSGFKWFISTTLAALAGIGVILVVIYASTNLERKGGVVKSIKTASLAALKPFQPKAVVPESLIATGQKADRLQISAKALDTQHIIHDRMVEHRDGREFIKIKPYVRIVSRLATARPDESLAIPPFDPFAIYRNPRPVAQNGQDGKTKKTGADKAVSVKVLELVGGIRPDEDMELPEQEVDRLVAEAGEDLLGGIELLRRAILEGDDQEGALTLAAATPEGGSVAAAPPNTTTLVKNILETASDDAFDDGIDLKIHPIAKRDNLAAILKKNGARPWQVKEILAAFNKIYPARKIRRGQELRLALIPATDGGEGVEPIQVSLYKGNKHLVTVFRSAEGGYEGSRQDPGFYDFSRVKSGQAPRRANIYTSLYQSALAQKLDRDTIMKLLRIHVYDTDFKRLVQPGDGFEAFFDVREDGKDGETRPGELLYTSMTIGGKKHAFYRFRTPDGVVDYYDAEGNSAKKFLMRRPIRGGRLTSRFGYRIHPISRVRRMHTGTDWAAPRGTPIMAAGNGTIVWAGRKGGYGIHVRIRHANGYMTTYSHMTRLAKGVKKGVRVRMGQIIGYVGNTGYSTGSHLHYEVLVNNRFVDSMKIHVPRGRKLTGKLLAEFQKQRRRIDELRHRAPVKTRVASVTHAAEKSPR